MTHTDETHLSAAGFVRVLARREIIALSFGAMIGWSWVLLTGEWLLRAGSLGTIIAFAAGGVAVICISLTYAELASAMPRTGGEHVYTLRALGRTPSFVCTWAIIMAYVTVPVFEAAALPTAFEYLFPDIKQGLLWQVQGAEVHASLVALGVLATVVMTSVNLLGIRFAAVFQTVVTAGFFLVGASFIAGAFAFGEPAPAGGTPVVLLASGGVGVLGVLIMVPALMVGFDVIPQSAEEADVEPRLIGVLLVVSVVMAVTWYVLITLAVSWSMSQEQLEAATIATADATAAVWGSKLAGDIMIVAGLAGMLTSWNAFIIGGSRVIYALAESGMMPTVFARLHPRYHTPWAAILLIGGLCCISPFFGRTILVWLIDAGSFAVVIAYGMVAFAFVRLRTNEPDLPRPFRVPAGRFVGWTAVVLAFLLGLLYLPFSPSALIWPFEWAIVLGWSLLGFILWRLAARES